MKKIFALAFCLISSVASLLAQDNTALGNEFTSQLKTRRAVLEPSEVRPISLYAEAGGTALSLLSINVDTRFAKTLNGWGGHTGISFMKVDNFSYLTIPVGVNYLLGKRGKYFELGAGATAMLSFGKKYESDGSSVRRSNELWSTSGIAGTLKIGYRYQPVNGGFSYGFGFAPVLFKLGDELTFWPYLPYLRIGYTF